MIGTTIVFQMVFFISPMPTKPSAIGIDFLGGSQTQMYGRSVIGKGFSH